MFREIQPQFGFQTVAPVPPSAVARKLERIGVGAVRRRFSPEFVNRIDAVITYEPLSADSLVTILDHQIEELRQHVQARLGARAFDIDVAEDGRRFLLEKGTSTEYGARELKRTVHRHLTQPLAAMVADGEIEPGSRVRVSLGGDPGTLLLHSEADLEAETVVESSGAEAVGESDSSRPARRRTSRTRSSTLTGELVRRSA